MRKVTLDELKELGVNASNNLWGAANDNNRDVKLYLHWSAGNYAQFFDDYHINIDSDGSIYVSTDDLSELKSHTYKRNSGAIGIALCCCVGATTNDLGDAPPTTEQIECISKVVAVLCKALNLTCDINRVMTHGEAADNLDGLSTHDPYGPQNGCERWDLAILYSADAWGSGGDIIRGKAIWYQHNGVG